MYRPKLAEQFEDLEKQSHAHKLGMWIFLGSETLIFAGLFALYAAYRVMYGPDFVAAAAHNSLFYGTLNTFILITSSFTVALAIHSVRTNHLRRVVPLIGVTILLGGAFLVVKFIEYGEHFAEGIYPGAHYAYAELPTFGAQNFFTLYYLMSGLHALHVVGGLAALAILAWLHKRRPYTPDHHVPLELGGLYWHLVDVVWIFIWPLLYLTR